MNRGSRVTRKVFSLLLAFLMVFGGMVQPFAGATEVYAAQTREAGSWEELRKAISDSASGDTVVITKDIVASKTDLTPDGTIAISGEKTVTIKAKDGENVTIWRKDGDGEGDFPMFQVNNDKAELILGDGLTLTGRTGNCSGGKVEKVEGNHELPEPTTTPGTHTYDSVDERPGEGDQYLYVDVQGGANRFGVTSSKDEAKNYLGAGVQDKPKARIYVEGNRIVKEQEGMQKQTLGVNGSQLQFQDNPLNPVRVADNGELWYNNTSWRIVFENGGLVASSSGTPVKVVSGTTPLGIITDGGSGGGTTTVWTVNGVEYTNKDDADAALAAWNEQDSTNVWTVNGVEYTTKEDAEAALAAWNEEDSYWTVDGEGHYDTEAEANAAAGGQGCDGEGCKIWYREQFAPGTVDKPRGFFVQVDKGTLNITGATLKNYISGPGVENVAPVVVNGTTAKFNMSGGSINHNEVGYSAVDSYINKAANVIEDQVKNNWKRTNSAGAVILTGGAEGSLTGGVIEHNRADAGAIIVEGNGTNSTASTQSTLTFTGGTINNNIGVHYGGGIYVYNNGLVEMGAEDNPGTAAIKDNFSWSKGGAVFASEEVYGSTKWNQPGTTEPVGDAAFILYGGTISGNMAVSRAGAIEVMSNHVILINGDIVNNSSRVLGGAIYVEGDGVDRMYTMVVRKGCVSANTAVKRTPQPATLSRVFKGTGNQCEKDNILGAPGAGTDIFDGKDYNNYYGYGGGIWLCSFGGNATFNLSDRYNVIVDGNTAATEGQDVQVHVPKAASPNGVNIVGVGNNKFVDEKTGEELVVGANYPGKLSIENANNVQGCDGIDGVNISGNVAAVGGGIAANGTVVFGEDTNVYAPMTSIKLSKTWGEGVNPETIKLKYYYRDDNGNRQEIEDLDGFEVTFDQKADIPGENDPTWEQIDGKGNSFADIAIPWTVTVNGETKPTFILGVDNDVTINYKDAKNNDRPFTGKEFDPSKEDHLAALWTGINNGTIDGTKLKIVKWNLEVVETNAAGEEIEYQLPDGEVANIIVEAHEQKTRTFYDKAKHELASINTAPIGFNFTTNIANEGPEEPEIEKYVNQAVHKDITLDEVFTYDIHAYVTRDAEKVVITDTLVPYLDFATGANNWYIQDLGPSNNHEVAYTVKGEPTSHVGDATVTLISKDGNKPDNNGFAVTGIGPHVNKKIETVTVDGKQTKRMVVTIANAANVGGNDVRGHWIKIRFDAKIKSGVTISDLQAEGVYKTVNQSDVEDRKAPNNGNQPTTATANHTGVPNTAEYEITARNEAKYEDTSNTVTVKPDTTKVEAEKKWTNTDGSPAEWPEDVESVEVNVFKVEGDNRELTATIVLTADEPKKQSEDIPKLKSGQRYELEETVISGYASTIDAMPSGSLSQGSESGVVVTNKKDDTEKPEIEKYVNEAVHKDILLDEEFVYDILAYVTKDADEVTITDTLHHYLDFVSQPNTIYVQDIGPKNNHKVTNDIAGIKQNDNSSVSYINPGKMLDSEYPIGIGALAARSIDPVTVDGKETKKLTIHIEDAEPYRGHWVKVRFTAKIKDGTTLEDLEAAGIYKTIKQSDVEDRSAPNKGNQPTNAGATHTGVPNVAEYEIKVGANPEYFDKSNTVTVKPETQELVVEKTWAGTENDEWPKDVTSVTFGIFQTKAGSVTEVKGTISEDGKYKSGTEDAVVKLNKEKTTITVTGLPKLTGVTYSAREIKVDDKEVKYGDDAKTAGIVKHSDLLSYIVKMIREKLEGSEIDNKFIANNSAPAIEKYVNKTVHAELETFNEEFTYDIMAFVPAGSTKITIKDELKEQLTLKSTEEDIKATIVYKEENDHKVNGSVKASGTAITKGVTLKPDLANAVEITVENTDGYLDGKWVQATLKAQINEEAYTDILKKITGAEDAKADEELNWATITKNTPVNGFEEDSHTGLINKASYQIEVGTESTSDYESNVVTVVPKTVTYAGEKAWEGLEEDVDWPQVEGKDIEVTFKLMKVDKDGVRSEVLGSDNKPVTVKVTKNAPTQDFPPQPKIDGVTYEVQEEPIPGYMIANESSTTDHETGKVTVKITNKPEGPEIEKYINKNVHKFIAPTETFTYDIIGYVTKDAVEVQFIDALVSSLQFAENPNVKIQDLGTEVDHKPNGSVSKTGTEIKQDAAGVEVILNKELKALTVNLTGDAAKAARGHWVKVTFDAELDSDLVKDLESGAKTVKDLDSNMVEVQKGVVLKEDAERPAENEGNLPVITDEKHKGLPNTSAYTIKAENGGTYLDKSNTVTVEPEKPEIEKYINQNVHQDITLEDTFTYDIIAYVTKDADKVVITDTLVDDLEFVSKAADISVVDLGETVDHKPYGSVNKSGGFVKASPTISGKTLTITIADAKDYRGHWVKATFEAKLDATVIEAINAGTKEISDLGFVEIKPDELYKADNSIYNEGDRPTPNVGNQPVESDEKHTGVPNTASYTISVGNENKYRDESNTVTVKPEKPSIEKYINKNVHEFVALDEVFTYDIIAYVPADADKVTITDELDKQLQFAKTGANVKVFDIGTTNNHKTADKAAEDKVDASVDNTDKEITEYATIKATNGKLEVVIANKISNIDNNTGIITYSEEKLSQYRGHYIRVQFDAQPADNLDIKSLTTVEITDNEHLDVTEAQKEHDGIGNKARYTVNVRNDGKYNSESNTVTVKPEEPEIAKYVNKRTATGTDKNGGVHTDLSAFYEIYTYDIQAYITKDATYAVITDELPKAVKLVGDSSHIRATVKDGDGADGMTIPPLSKESEDLGSKVSWSAEVKENEGVQTIVVEIGEANNKEILPVAGQWVQITFEAQIKDEYKSLDAIKKEKGCWATVTKNDPISDVAKVDKTHSGATKDSHEGIVNEASYTINLGVDNKWKYEDKSNTVTVQPKTIKVSGTKTWDDNDNQDGKRPESITINLIADGTPIDKATVKPAADGTWTYTFTGLPENKANGTKINYTITEEPVTDYSTAIDGYNVTNTHTPGKTAVLVEKVWDDEDNLDKTRPVLVAVALRADGAVQETVTLNESNNWKHTFTDLDLYSDGKPVEYTVDEVTVPEGYEKEVTLSGTTFIIKNSHKPNEFPIKISKKELGGDELEGAHIVVRDETGKIVDEWDSTKTFHELNLKPGKYTMQETVAPEGFQRVTTTIEFEVDEKGKVTLITTTVDGGGKISLDGDDHLILEDAPEKNPEKRIITVAKAWNDFNDQDKLRPTEIQVVLKADGEEVETVTLNEANYWMYTWEDLDMEKDGEEIQYTVEELNVPSGYTSSQRTSSTVTTITNSHTPERPDEPTPGKKNIPVTKVWDDENNFEGHRPTSVTVNLIANGRPTGETLLLSDANNWTGYFTNLDAVDADGNAITYTVDEEFVPFYVTTILGTETTGYTVRNYNRPWIPEIPGTPGEQGKFSVQKMAKGGVPTDRTYAISVKMTDPFGEVYATTINLKPGDDPYYFEYVLKGTRVEIAEITTGYYVTYTVDGIERQDFTLLAGDDLRVIVLNDDAWPPNTPGRTPGVPKSGDPTDIFGWMAILALAAALAGAVVLRKRVK